MNLDWVAAFSTGVAALCVFGLHVITSPGRRHWISLPAYIRSGLFLFGMMLMIRSIDFIEINGNPEVPGHINAKGALTSLLMAYVMAALLFHALKYTYPARVWVRLEYIARLASCRSNNRRTGAAVAELASQGVKVFGPKDPPRVILDVEDTRPVTDMYHEEFSR